MKRTKSSISLSKLAKSVKQSIELDQYREKKKSFTPLLRSSASSLNILTANICQQYKKTLNEDYLMLATKKSAFLSQTNEQKNKNQEAFTQSKFQTIKNKSLYEKAINHQRQFQSKNQSSEEAEQVTIHELKELQKQRENLSRKIELIKKQKSTSNKSYCKQLEQVEKLNAELQLIEEKQTEFIEKMIETKNRQRFLEEQISSRQMNYLENLAEKEFCEEFLANYQQSDLKEQAQIVMKLLSNQSSFKKLQSESLRIKTEIKQIQTFFKQWRQSQNIDIKQKKQQRKLQDLRLNLMRVQENLDHRVDQLIKKEKEMQESQQYFNIQNPISNTKSNPLNDIRKIREFICIYFKRYNQININHISQAQIADGIDMFLCKEGLVKDFASYISQSTKVMTEKDPLFKAKLEEYLKGLQSIEDLLALNKTELSKVVSKKYQDKIFSSKQHLQKVFSAIESQKTMIDSLTKKLEVHLASESICVIECLNQQKGQHFDVEISQIQSKAKELKLAQINRIKTARQFFQKQERLDAHLKSLKVSEETNKQSFLTQKQQLSQNEVELTQNLESIREIKDGFTLKKQSLQKVINRAVQSMKQEENLSNTLRALEEQIAKLKKQKIEHITQKYLSNKQKVFLPSDSTKQNFNRNLTPFSSSEANDPKNGKSANEQFCVQNIRKLKKFTQASKSQNKLTAIECTQEASFSQSSTPYIADLCEKNDQQTNCLDMKKPLQQQFQPSENLTLSKYDLIESKTVQRKSVENTKPSSNSNYLKRSKSTYDIENKQNNCAKNDNEEMLLQSYNSYSVRNKSGNSGGNNEKNRLKKSASQSNKVSKRNSVNISKKEQTKWANNSKKSSGMKLSLSCPQSSSKKNAKKLQTDHRMTVGSLLESKMLKRC